MSSNDQPNAHSSPPFSDVTGVILAGGRSRRMGRDKASLPVAGQPLIERTIRLFQSLFRHTLIAGDRPDLAGPELPAYPDEYPGSALGGLYTGLLRAPTPHIFVAACDMPLIEKELIQRLLSYRHKADVVLPQTPAGLEPLLACYHRSCLPMMQQQLEQQQFRILDLFPLLNTRILTDADLPPGWQAALTNINTPEEYGNLLKEKLC
ncbi:MAG: molybdenum cofactor guanylyltransferase [Desulfuromonadaceae bacterium]